MLVVQPSLLFIDAYDSFTNNIISLLTTTLSCTVRVLHIDAPGFETYEALRDELRHYDAVVCGPGPGNPLNEKDVGIMARIWQLSDEDLIPVLGICLGFQSLAVAFGASIRRLNQGLHGMVRKINHVGEDSNMKAVPTIFDNVGQVRTTLYQSLCIGVGQEHVSEQSWQSQKWKPPAVAPGIRPLAWVEDVSGQDQRILVAIQHITKPFWGLQYHPESICTNEESKKVILNWFMSSQRWNKENCKISLRGRRGIQGQVPVRKSLLEESKILGHGGASRLRGHRRSVSEMNCCIDCYGLNSRYESRIIDLPDHVSTADIVEGLQGGQHDKIILESSNAHVQDVGTAKVRGRYSIIGLDISDTLRIEYQCGAANATVCIPQTRTGSGLNRESVPLSPLGGVWEVLAAFLEHRRINYGDNDSPFWGGFMGYTTYELGLQGIDVDAAFESEHRPRGRPDLCFAWVRRSVVIDHWEKKVHVQQLVDNDVRKTGSLLNQTRGGKSWLDQSVFTLESIFKSAHVPEDRGISANDIIPGMQPLVSTPQDSMYESKVEECQEYIRNGDAYELCLTDQTRILLRREEACAQSRSRGTSLGPCVQPKNAIALKPSEARAWSLYKQLRKRQPAPFASFIRLGTATFISASPERFLKWDENGKCELRPMKGTVRKSAQVSTLAQAEKLLQIPKEQAENLMIVDLVRHDLHGVCGSGNVTVPRLLVVEEYASVFQMISVVEGRIPQVCKDATTTTTTHVGAAERIGHTGIDVLAASLPPGSMTGAPKKRACEILRAVEGTQDRSLYSGVVGYMDVGGRGDFSVNIRCMFRWDDNDDDDDKSDEGHRTGPHRVPADGRGVAAPDPDHEVWHVGAGGAVTALSTTVGEREEMQTKLNGTLGLFREAP
ncbi:MAG: hypothetical protein M1818_005919 [Claussenomyces sp. TS43310]|nr:MAG: hypothetical protein M1818_005919 [Claussenomyces sp. TS43310]